LTPNLTKKIQLISGSDSIGHGGTVSGRTAKKKLTKLCWSSRKRSPKRLIVLVQPKMWRGTTNFFQTLSRRTGYPPPLSNSFSRNCNWLTGFNAI